MEEQNITNERNRLANTVVKNHMIWSMGAGFIPIPVADFLAIGAIQLDMVRQLCKVYNLSFKESEGKALVSALTSSTLAKLGARAVIKLIPGFGQIIGGMTLAILSGASTYALGEVFKRHFESGGTILDFDAERLKKMYDEKFEKGKDIARKIKVKQDKAVPDEVKIVDDPDFTVNEQSLVDQIKGLHELKESGALTQEEFEQAKKLLLEG